jgi:hypothetical protein
MSDGPLTSSESLNSAEREALASLVRTRGESGALRHVRISRNTLYRCLAGLQVRRGTAMLVRAALTPATRGPLTSKPLAQRRAPDGTDAASPNRDPLG